MQNLVPEAKKSKGLYAYSPQKAKSKFRRYKPHKFLIRKKSKYITKILVALLVTSIFFLTYKYIYKSDYFLIKNIEVYGTDVFVNEKDLAQMAYQNVNKDYIFSADIEQLKTLLKENFLGISEIRIRKDYPSTLVIDVVEREPLAIVYNLRDTDYYLVDVEGYVLGTIDPETSELPQVIYNEPLHVGINLDKDIVPLYLSVLSSAEDSNLKASSLSIKKKHIEFYSDRTRILLDKEKDIPASIKIVQKLVTQLNLEGQSVNKIDLRYDKVIVQYEEE